jgi:hypothetical protein
LVYFFLILGKMCKNFASWKPLLPRRLLPQ